MQRLTTPPHVIATGHMNGRQRASLKASGHLRLYPGYCVPAPSATAPQWEQNAYIFEATLLALAKSARTPLVFTGQAGAFLSGAPLIGLPKTIDAYNASGNYHGRPAGPNGEFTLKVRTPPLALDDWIQSGPFRIAPHDLCMFDLARFCGGSSADASSLLHALCGLNGSPRTFASVDRWRERSQDLRAEAIALCGELPRKCSPTRARKVLERTSGLCESPAEAVFWDIITASGIVLPQQQAPIQTTRGTKWADAAWSRDRVIVEVDGDMKFLGSDGSERLLAERKRNLALEEAGWRVLHVDWNDLKNSHALTARILAALNSAAA